MAIQLVALLKKNFLYPLLGDFWSSYYFDLLVAVDSERLYSKASLIKTRKSSKDQKTFASTLQNGHSEKIEKSEENDYVGVFFLPWDIIETGHTKEIFWWKFLLLIGTAAASHKSFKLDLVMDLYCVGRATKGHLLKCNHRNYRNCFNNTGKISKNSKRNRTFCPKVF